MEEGSENNLMTSCWGPIGWAFIHSIVMGYPAKNPSLENKSQYKTFFENMGNILPCYWCRKNYEKNLKTLPIDSYLDSRKKLALWAYKIHNMVNDELGVPQNKRPTFDYVYNLYEGMRSASCGGSSGVCHDPESQKRCRVQFLNGSAMAEENREAFSASSSNCNVFAKYWYLIVIIVILVIVIVLLCISKLKIK